MGGEEPLNINQQNQKIYGQMQLTVNSKVIVKILLLQSLATHDGMLT